MPCRLFFRIRLRQEAMIRSIGYYLLLLTRGTSYRVSDQDSAGTYPPCQRR